MKVLVTGNKGYIGSVLCRKLLEEGFEVAGMDTGYYDGCDFQPLGYSIRQITKDVRNITREDLAGFDAVIHLAALSNDPIGELNSQLTREVNFMASVDLAKKSREAQVKRFVFSSSCSVYGVAGDNAIDENGKLAPATEYAKSKVDSEKEIAKLADEYFSPVFLRNATVYGVSPMLRVDLVVNNLAAWAHTTGEIKVMSDGSPWRPLIHIQDICQAFIAALKAPREAVHGQVFNIGGKSENYRVRDVVAAVKKAMPDCRIEYTGEHGADTRTYRVDFGKAAKMLGQYFKPQWNVTKGAKELLDAYRAAGFSRDDFQGEKYTRLKRINALISQKRVDSDLFWKGGKE